MSKISRRRFFEESMIVAAAAASVTRSTSALAKSGKSSPGDTIRHAVIGCRVRGRQHVDGILPIPGVEIAYVCDPDRELAGKLAETASREQNLHGKGRTVKAVHDMREIFDDPSIDTVSIATPNHWHALGAIWAMRAGKDVYLEKPVSHNISEGRRIIQVARKTGRLCQTGTQRRSMESIKAVADYIGQGKLGDISLGRAIVYRERESIGPRGTYPLPPQVDYNLWLGPAKDLPIDRPQFHYDWHWDWNTGNGELGNNGIHICDVCRWVMGLQGFGSRAISVGGRLGYEDAGETPNTHLVVNDYGGENGENYGGKKIIMEIRGLRSDPYRENFDIGYVIHGSEGYIAGESLFDPEGNLVRTFEGEEGNHFANFFDAVRSGRREDLNADIAEGHASSAMTHVGNISHRLGKLETPQEIAVKLESYDLGEAVSETFSRLTAHLQSNGVDMAKTQLTLGSLLEIDQKQETFIDNLEADAFLTREYRAPFVVPGENDV